MDQSVELADVVHRFGDRLRAIVALPRQAHKVLNAIAVCRTAALGGHRHACERCGYEHHVYHSCRNRHCPKCQQLAKAAWLEAREAELLPVPYFHLVFTVPHHLNALFLAHKRLLLKLLFQSVSATLLAFGDRHLGGQVGFTAILHTWDQRLNAHFHLHVLIPCGALTEGGSAWRDADTKFLFPVRALSKVYRGKFIAGLKRLADQKALESDHPVKDLIDRSYHHPWVVYAKAPFGSPATVLSYLGRYTHRVAISNDRILAIDDHDVVFNFRNRRQGDQVQTMRLDGVSFLRRFVLHTLPARFVRIRHYGFLGNRVRSKNITRLQQLLAHRRQPESDPIVTEASEPNASEPPAPVGSHADVTPVCPRCNGPLRVDQIAPYKPWQSQGSETWSGQPILNRARAP